ncbi:MAG: TrpB-like pyridoxal phosphate-dependent enzyme [Gammaproteobacteria bacterium]|nr:TrpB-like pyridoxal phosphate-dependent enzyme [Gammaproteobacteria bacterium]MYD79260.1 TrpB-like pyridoxal phosphate-dependent enzyme [Gammaproteobacteria bacterium]
MALDLAQNATAKYQNTGSVTTSENKIFLPESQLPRNWYNIVAELPFDVPKPLHPIEDRPVEIEDYDWLWPLECLRIELQEGKYGTDALIEIPNFIAEVYRRYRPSPLVRARSLEKYLGTTSEIYYKREDLNPAGSHKFNTALVQAYYATLEEESNIRSMVTDTGAGQWGAALAMACETLGLGCDVFMIRKSFEEKPYRRYLMRMAGANVFPSPSELTQTGRNILRDDPSNSGSLGIGMSEAIEYVKEDRSRRLALGCMSYYAVLHQSIIGLETKRQLEQAGRSPDLMVGCVGGGSNFTGFIAPFVPEKIGGSPIEFRAIEPDSIPTLSQGEYRYDWADFSELTPRILMYTLGHRFVPPPVHSGGLRYHGKTPVLSALVKNDVVNTRTYGQKEVFEAGQVFLKTEGVLAAPESAHAVLGAIDAAKTKQKQVIVLCLSGHGYLDLKGFSDVLDLDSSN